MKRKLAKIALGTLGVLVLAVVGLLTYVQLRWDRTYDVAEPDIHASTDTAVIARGAYLAYGPAHCASCHITQDKWPQMEAGEAVPLSGGYVFDIPVGTFRTPNLTPDRETGIGRYSDGQLARMLRHAVRHDGRASIPFMETQNLSDEDVVALISFLRSQPAVRNEVPDHDVNLLGRAIMTFLIRPKGPTGTPPATTPAQAPTVERGEYIATRVASCAGCHTQRSMVDGSYQAPLFSGGGRMPMDSDPTKVFVTPNLTPDPKTGRITNWTEDQFVARFRAGRIYKDSHMPWPLFQRMSDDDLRAVYRYLRTLKPVENETGPSVQDAE